MSTIELTELKKQLSVLSRPERQEVLAFLNGMEAREQGKAEATVRPQVSFEQAKAFLYSNCDSLLHRLAQ